MDEIQMERAELQKTEERLSRAQAIAHVGDWEWDVATNEVHWSDELYRIYGYKPGEIAPDYGLVLQQMHPDSKDKFLAAIDGVLKEDRHFELDYRFFRNDGTEAVLHTIGKVTRDGSDAPIRMVGIVQDITERVKSELRLRESEDKFRTIFEQATDGILIADAETSKFVEANKAICAMLGYSRDEITGLSVDDIHPIKELPAIRAIFQKQLSGEISFSPDIPMLRKDGSVFYADINADQVTLGGKLGLVGVFRDITERKQLEEEREESLLFIETLLKNAPVGIRVFDGESGNCLLANKVTAEIAGGNIESVQSQNFRALHSWQASGLLEVAEAVLADGSARKVETNMLTSFGKKSFVSYIVSRLVVKEKPHLLIIGRDISIEKQLDDKNRKMEAQMLHVQKLESLGVLAGGIAHDFNNILQAIHGNAELALMRLKPESPALNNLQQIEKATQRAAALAQQMLAYSGKGRFVIKPLDINTLITEMDQILEVSISKKTIIRLNLAKNIPLFEGDATQIHQIIMNLVINASEAIGDEGGDIAITTGSINCDQDFLSRIWLYDKLEEGDYIYFEITDTGCGMNMDTLEKIFDPFFTTKFTGRGLGMAAVLGIVRGHHGAITVYSEPGKGTSFKVFLPAIQKNSEIMSRKTTPTMPVKGTGTILLVDDEETILELCKDMLEGLGYRILLAENGAVALEVFRDHNEVIDCVILDLTMPRLDGEQTFRELRRIDPNVQVILSSGYNEQEVTHKFIGKGLAGFIQKPYKLVELSQKLQQVLKGR